MVSGRQNAIRDFHIREVRLLSMVSISESLVRLGKYSDALSLGDLLKACPQVADPHSMLAEAS